MHPPKAPRKSHSFTHHGITVEDPWHWLRDPDYPTVETPEILDYLNAENSYFEAQMGGQKPLVDALFKEMRARIKEADRSVPQKDGEWLYWTEFEEGAQYVKHWRKPALKQQSGRAENNPALKQPSSSVEKDSAAQLILDEPALAQGKDYFRLYAFSVSPCGRYLAYSVDDNGSERFTAQVKDLETGELLPDTIPGTLSGLVWTSDSQHILYCLANEQWRTDNVHVHRLGSDSNDDREIYHEDDEGFRVSVGLSSSERFIVIATGDHETSEVRLLPAGDPFAEPLLVKARVEGVEYDVDDHGETLFILANDDHVNFRLARAHLSHPGEWETVIEGSDEFYITGVTTFADFYVVEGRENGLDQVEIRSYADHGATRIAFPEASYSAGLSDNPEYAVDRLRLSYTSMVTPGTVYDYHLADARLEVLKVQEIPSGYDAESYVTERLMIASHDGVAVPVSLVRHVDTPVDGSAPLHLYGYGAYGLSIDPAFSTTRLSLVDRGFIYAIAHIRGGDDLGRQWYRDGKREQRTNTFEDFVAVARGLVERNYTSKGRITISGGSAGGELMGAAVNMAPELFGAVVAHVPFVDVLNTMLDASLPLTPGEWSEWGNPITDRAAFELIRSYSPYDNVSAQDYPPMLVTAGLNDPRVTYWEPAKWVAKLREMKTDDNLLLLKTNMGAGHGGKSGRWDSLQETAEEIAFILWQTRLAE